MGASDSFLNKRFGLSNNSTDNITTVRLAKEDVTFKTSAFQIVPILLDGKIFDTKFHVVDSLSEDAILERDWFQMHNAILDFV
ncbi:unnamed protein product [Ceutorhynchus assimilis]|uniref:Uncharacterized protein n=1 Tax=Ceutorhynchus assimilis TaxID=467358 RepID=A0A9N9QDL2_9CUCU|nr:unnamed protein product [Ceutorhynchus assimilis]